MNCPIIDLGLNEQHGEDNRSLLERDSPPISVSNCIDKPIYEQDHRAKEAGRLLNDNRLISLLFLLLSNTKRALELCQEIESKTLVTPEGMSRGEAILQSLLSCVKQNPSWELKIICALHMIKAYKVIVILQPRLGPGGCTKTRQEYEGKERFFIDPIRIALLDIAKDLRRDDARKVMKQMKHPHQDWTWLETAFLQMMQSKSQNSILKIVARHIDIDHKPEAMPLVHNLRSPSAVELKRGRLLVLVMEKYDENRGYSRREGTQPDIDAVVRTWEKFGCHRKHITVERDRKGDELLPAMERFKDKLNESQRHDIDYCVVCIIGHGRINPQTNLEEIVGVDGKGVPREVLEGTLNNARKCPILLGIPKIWLINACRGLADNETINMARRDSLSDSGIDTDSGGISENSWHMIVSSTVKGNTSLRHKQMGSFFIQILCLTMEQFWEHCTFSEIIRETSKSVQKIIGQVPQWTSCITEEFFFTKT